VPASVTMNASAARGRGDLGRPDARALGRMPASAHTGLLGSAGHVLERVHPASQQAPHTPTPSTTPPQCQGTIPTRSTDRTCSAACSTTSQPAAQAGVQVDSGDESCSSPGCCSRSPGHPAG
jgi:hypothetical protein